MLDICVSFTRNIKDITNTFQIFRYITVFQYSIEDTITRHYHYLTEMLNCSMNITFMITYHRHTGSININITG